VDHREVREAVDRVREACERHDIPLGIFTIDPAEARRRFAEGFRFVGVGIDARFLITAAAAAAREAAPPR